MSILSVNQTIALATLAWDFFNAANQKYDPTFNGPSFSAAPNAPDCEWRYGFPDDDYIEHADYSEVSARWRNFGGTVSPLKEKLTTNQFEINLLGKVKSNWFNAPRYYHFNFHVRVAAGTVPLKVAMAQKGGLSTASYQAQFPSLP